MKKRLIILMLAISVLSSCVSKKTFLELDEQYKRLLGLNDEMEEENNQKTLLIQNLRDSILDLETSLSDSRDGYDKKTADLEDEKRKYDDLQNTYDLLSTKSSSALARNAKTNRDLLSKLQEKEKELADESSRLEDLKKELDIKGQRISDLNDLLAKKEGAMKALKQSIVDALKGFEGNGLTVTTKDGKVLVSLENKLLFNSGSWTVGTKGKDLVKQLAKVLVNSENINVQIEGHTDDDPYSGHAVIKDNWDLSVKRATAIVRILQDNDVDPKMITAAGKGEYSPLNSNSNKTEKSINRRIEIVLAPNLDAILKLLNE
ncbi:MAG: OmpA family protein [Flavobacteriaceae bacterium]|nr:OmpA family protein [Flavobacteriaceae bacterium]